MTTTKHDAFDPNQERDETGKWTSTGSGDSKAEVKKAAGGGYHEIKQNRETGFHEATHVQAGKRSAMGVYSSPGAAKAAIAKHEESVKASLRTTGANSARVQNQVTAAIHAAREQKNAAMGQPLSSSAQTLIAQSTARVEARQPLSYKPPAGKSGAQIARERQAEAAKSAGKREPLRFQGKSLREKAEQSQRDLVKLHERMAARSNNTGPYGNKGPY